MDKNEMKRAAVKQVVESLKVLVKIIAKTLLTVVLEALLIWFLYNRTFEDKLGYWQVVSILVMVRLTINSGNIFKGVE